MDREQKKIRQIINLCCLRKQNSKKKRKDAPNSMALCIAEHLWEILWVHTVHTVCTITINNIRIHMDNWVLFNAAVLIAITKGVFFCLEQYVRIFAIYRLTHKEQLNKTWCQVCFALSLSLCLCLNNTWHPYAHLVDSGGRWRVKSNKSIQTIHHTAYNMMSISGWCEAFETMKYCVMVSCFYFFTKTNNKFFVQIHALSYSHAKIVRISAHTHDQLKHISANCAVNHRFSVFI